MLGHGVHHFHVYSTDQSKSRWRPGISGVANYTLLTGRTEVFSPHMEKSKDAQTSYKVGECIMETVIHSSTYI